MSNWFKNLLNSGVVDGLALQQKDELKVINSLAVHCFFANIGITALFVIVLPEFLSFSLFMSFLTSIAFPATVIANRRKSYLLAKYIFSFSLTLIIIMSSAYFGLQSNFQFLLVVLFFGLIFINKSNSQENLIMLFIVILMSSASLLFLYVKNEPFVEIPHLQVRMLELLVFCTVIIAVVIVALINYSYFHFRRIVPKGRLDKLDEEASMFRAVSDNIIGGMFRSTPRDGLVYANRDFLRLFAFETMDVAMEKKPDGVYAYPEERERMLLMLRNHGHIEQQRIYYKRADGTFFWGSLTARLTFENGKTHIDGTIVDISDAVEKENELLERDKQLEEAQSLARLGSWQIDLRSYSVEWSNEMYSIFGYGKHEAVPGLRDFLAILEVEQLDEALSGLIEMAADSMGPHTYSSWITTRKGEAKYVRSIFHFESDQEGVSKLNGTVQDITEQRLMQDRLIETKEFYERILDSAPIEIVILDSEMRFTFFNDKAVSDLAMKKWLLGKTDADYCDFRKIDPELANNRMRHYQAAMNKRSLVTWEEQMMNRNGEIEHVARNVFPLISENSSPTHLISFGFSVTKMRKAQAVLEHRNDELQKLNEELDRFVYSVSHDLRAPIASVLGLINIGVDVKTNIEAQEVFAMQRDALERLDSYIKDVIDHSRNKRLEVVAETVIIRSVFEEVIDGLRFLPSLEKVRIGMDIPSDLVLINDPVRFKVALNNLLSNAIRYSDLKKDAPFVRIHAEAYDGGVSIKVEDNGIGIRKEYQEKVWDMFFRGTAKSGGSGLGLYILKETIDKMGGSISLESEEKVGSTFSMKVPNR